MFTFNLTMDQLLAIRQKCETALATPIESDEGIAFNAKTLSFSHYMLGWEWEDLNQYDICFDNYSVDAMIGKIASCIGASFPETEEERQALEEKEDAMIMVQYLDKGHVALTMASGTNWAHNKTGSFLSTHAPFYIRPYDGDKMEIVNSKGERLLRTSRIVKGLDSGSYMYVVTENGHKYNFVTVESL